MSKLKPHLNMKNHSSKQNKCLITLLFLIVILCKCTLVFSAPLSGTYTIGSIASNYSSITSAVSDLSSKGVSGPVIFNIKTGTYSEQVSIAQITGASSSNTITFQSASGSKTDVVLNYSSTTSANNYVIKLNGADYVSIKNMSLKNTGTTYSKVIEITNGSNYNTVNNCSITGGSNSGSSTDKSLIFCSYIYSNEYNQFLSNTFQTGTYGIYYQGKSNSYARGIVISDNTFSDVKCMGIRAYWVNAAVITQNIVNASTDNSFVGVYLGACSNGTKVEKNKVNGGIGTGLYLINANGTSSSAALIDNNFIQAAGQCIYIHSSSYLNFYFNNVNYTGTSGADNVPLYFANSSSNLKFYNNVFVNAGSGYLIYSPANVSISSSTFDYNDYYSSSSSKLMYWGGVELSSLSAWKSATAYDAHSVSVNPLFTSDVDLHMNQAVLNNAGKVISDITTDIDGETRNSSTPDIGADEREGFIVITDIGINALLAPTEDKGLSAVDSIKVKIENFGNTTITNLDVAYIINSGAQVTEHISGLSLLPGDKINYTFNTVQTELATLKSLTVKVFTILAADTTHSNDALTTTLNWLPDLKVTSLTVAPSFNVEGSIDLSWTVLNDGTGSTGSTSWKDRVWLSVDNDLRGVDDILLATVQNLTYLHANKSYTQTISLAIPKNTLAGNYILFVTSDNDKAVEKVVKTKGSVTELNECNNYKTDTVLLTYPASADLKITSIGLPTSAYSGDSITVTYTGQNSGASNITNQSWTDNIYISSSASFDVNTATLVGSVSNASSSLAVNASYSSSKKLKLPNAIYGTYYVFVYANENKGVTEYSNVYSNVKVSNAINLVLTPPADLIPQSISCSSTANSGKSVLVSWTVKNNGANAPYESLWTDKVYISTASSFNVNNATLIGTYYKLSGTSLSVGSSYTATESFSLPNGISGTYYVYVVADADNMVFEYNGDNNNTLKSTNVFVVSLSPSPDFVITSSTLADTVYAAYSSTISWSVSNQGTSSANKWLNGLYLSSDKILSSNDVLLDTLTTTALLTNGSATTLSTSISFDNLTLKGKYYILLNVDANDDTYEYNGENNNTFTDSVIIDWKYADLNATNFTAPSTVHSGETVSVSWDVANIGNGVSYSNGWYDYIYLSTNNTYDAADTKLELKYKSGFVNASSSYSQTMDVDFPNGISGNYYLILAVDPKHKITNETNYANNNLAVPISISLASSSDLVISSTNVASSVYPSQQVYVSYSVTNEGTVATEYKDWYVGVYVSNTTNLSDYDVKLAQKKANKFLNPSETYTDSILITVPSYLSGNYYMVVKADCNKKVYEYLHEDNNLNSDLTNILTPKQTDLVVSAMSVPASITLGNKAAISYTVTNAGANTAVGDLRDIAYLSSNNTLNTSDDLMFKYKDSTVTINPGQSITCTLSEQVSGLLPGNYYGIMNTNTLGTISENNSTNNQYTSLTTSAVSVNALTLDVVSTANLDYKQNLYYQVSVTADLDLLLTLTSNQTETGNNEVYIAYNRIPSSTDYDYKQENADSLNQQVLIPSTESGTYYVLIKTQSMFASAQSVSVLAHAMPFSITSIDPSTVGQGTVTSTIKGAGFREGIKVYLKDANNTIVDTAEIREYSNSMKMIVRWTLADVALGTYNIVAVNTDLSTATLTNGLTVVAADEYNVTYVQYAPDWIRRGNSAFYTYQIKNSSNIDVPYFIGYFMVDSTVEIVETKINGKVFESAFIDTTSGKTKYWIDINGRRYMPIHLKDLQPNEEVNIDFSFKNFEKDSFRIAFLYKAISKKTKINNILIEADSVRNKVFSNLAYYTPYLGNDIINFMYDQKNFRKFYINFLAAINDLSSEDTVGINYNYNIFNKGNNTTYKTQQSPTEFAECTADVINKLNSAMWDGWKTGLGDTNPVTALFLSDDPTEAALGIAGIAAIGLGAFAVSGSVATAAGVAGLALFAYGVGSYAYDLSQTMDGCNDDNSTETPVEAGADPNEIAGPSGLGNKQWVAVNDKLSYTVYFENDSLLAEVAAQKIEITQTLDEHVDPYTFSLGNFSFANINFEVPANSITYSTTLDLVDTLGVNVNVTAGLDVVNHKIFWIFNSIDPNTGKTPIDPTKGLLPVNNSTGIGQGFVTYSIKPSLNAQTGDTIKAYADIIFDVNEPVTTNTHFNIVDAYAPATVMSALAANYPSPEFILSWNASDDNGTGSGIANYDVYVSHNGAAYQLYEENIVTTSIDFIGDTTDHSLSFYVVAKDSVGNMEEKSIADVSTLIGNAAIILQSGENENKIKNLSTTFNINEVNINTDEIIGLYPNPTSDFSKITVNIEKQESYTEINVIDLTGKIIEQLHSGNLELGKHVYQWNTQKYNSGIYLVMVKTDDKIYQKRLVVVKK